MDSVVYKELKLFNSWLNNIPISDSNTIPYLDFIKKYKLIINRNEQIEKYIITRKIYDIKTMESYLAHLKEPIKWEEGKARLEYIITNKRVTSKNSSYKKSIAKVC